MPEIARRQPIGRVVLTLDDLRQLLRLLLENAPPNVRLSVTAKYEDVTIEVSSLDALLAHDDLPDTLDYLAINVGDREHSNGPIHIYIHDQLYSNIEVCGSDRAWVIGKETQLVEFFARKLHHVHRVRYIFARRWLASVVLGLAAGLLIRFAQNINPLIFVLAAISLLHLGNRYISWIGRSARGLSRIEIRPRGRRIPRDQIANYVSIVIACLSLVVAFADLLVALIP